MKHKYVIKKYDGDDQYSYAIFHSKDVKGMGNQIFYGQAKPIICGLSRNQASYYKKDLRKNANAKMC